MRIMTRQAGEFFTLPKALARHQPDGSKADDLVIARFRWWQTMTLAAKLNQTLRGKAPWILNILGRRGLDMRRSRAVASFAFDPGPHTAGGIGRVAIETPCDHIRSLFRSQSSLDVGRRLGAVAHRQSRAITHGIPGDPVLEKLPIDRTHWRDPANSGPEGPFQCRRSALATVIYCYLNSFRGWRVPELQPALLLNGMPDQLGRNRTLQNWRERPGVGAMGLLCKLRGVALTALCRPDEVTGLCNQSQRTDQKYSFNAN